MTWKYKLPEQPRSRYSARDLAVSLGVTLQAVIDALAAIGEYVDSPNRRAIEEPVKRALCAHLDCEYEPPAVTPISPWSRQDRGRPEKVDQPRPPTVKANREDLRPRIVKAPDRSVGLGNPADDASPAMEDWAWKLYGFNSFERDAWCVYLRPGQAKYANDLHRAGFVPEDLAVEVAGWTVHKRLRAGETPAEVMRLLVRSRTSETG